MEGCVGGGLRHDGFVKGFSTSATFGISIFSDAAWLTEQLHTVRLKACNGSDRREPLNVCNQDSHEPTAKQKKNYRIPLCCPACNNSHRLDHFLSIDYSVLSRDSSMCPSSTSHFIPAYLWIYISNPTTPQKNAVEDCCLHITCSTVYSLVLKTQPHPHHPSLFTH